MITFDPTSHRAFLPDWDSVEIPGQSDSHDSLERQTRFPQYFDAHQLKLSTEQSWDSIDDLPSKNVAQKAVDTRSEISAVASPLKDLLDEGVHQYREVFEGTIPVLHSIRTDSQSFARKLWSTLKQPVWIPGRGEKVKEYKRGTLFFLDVFRFGGTFAAIFAVLFLALNYQSFWQIAAAHVTPLIDSPSLDYAAIDGGSPSHESHVARPTTGLLAFLPNVGPPANTLVIPKIGITVPLVSPSTEALLRQDWPQVDKDIQDALIHGAVHYPGTARPGQAGNAFVTAHSSNYPWVKSAYNTVGARFQELVPGDEYWIYYGGDAHKYVVRSVRIVSPSDVTVLDQPADERISTLMTCDPVGTTLRRRIVVAQEVDPETGVALKVGQHGTQEAPKIGIESLPI